ncbi:heterocyst frequency control protein PatD [Calothrix rhizosoleniae]|uniref:heterocyst frequency control protein PatD n=1 Tax=Calothrix rhizosoleniae TaxID=888997 RepID=UPI002E0EC4DD
MQPKIFFLAEFATIIGKTSLYKQHFLTLPTIFPNICMYINNQPYQAFVNLLEQLRNYTITAEPDAPQLQQQIMSLRKFYQQQILTLAPEDTENQNLSQINSYHTEISKQLRLLEMDMIFLQGARQTTTVQTRLQAINDRLNTLIQYCDAILKM